MPRTALTVQIATLAGITPTYTAVDAANGNSFVHSGGEYLIHTKNTAGSPHTMTIQANGATVGGLALADGSVTVPATTGDKMVLITDAAGVIQSDGSVWLDWSDATTHTVAIIKVG